MISFMGLQLHYKLVSSAVQPKGTMLLQALGLKGCFQTSPLRRHSGR